ncbi:MAG: hypothetical protein OEN55_06880 [Alphaproteobacteria bacterium]|nr:hypothetical protein [Alphaproteobacteria bacterium]
MMVVSENEHTEETIKAELEQLYLAAGYIHAEQGNMDIAMNLIGAAIAELEGILETRQQPTMRLVHDADKLCDEG